MPVPTPTRVPRGLLTHSLGTVLAVAALSFGCAGSDSPNQATRDANTVRCLAPRYRAELVDAAVTLGLASRGALPETLVVRGRRFSLEQWRQERSADFNRSCAALVAATGRASAPGESGPDPVELAFLAAALSLLAGLVTAMFGGFITSRLTSAGQRRLRADALRRAGRELSGATTRYVDSWLGNGPRDSAELLLARRRALLDLLEQEQLHNPRWRALLAARAEFDAPPFDRLDELDAAWLDPATDRAECGHLLRDRVHRLTAVAYWAADRLEHPVRSWWRTGNRLPSPEKLTLSVPAPPAPSAGGRAPG